jgi:hypothetical protein
VSPPHLCLVLTAEERLDLAAICKLYLSVDPLGQPADCNRRRALARRVINETKQNGRHA